jgi:hypothetical protein
MKQHYTCYFTVAGWIADPEVLWCWIEKSSQLTGQGYELSAYCGSNEAF